MSHQVIPWNFIGRFGLALECLRGEPFGFQLQLALAIPLPFAVSHCQLIKKSCFPLINQGDLSGSFGVDLRKKPLPMLTCCSFLHKPLLPGCPYPPPKKSEKPFGDEKELLEKRRESEATVQG